MHKSNGGFDFWDKEKDKVIDMYVNDKMSSCKIAKIYGCTASAVRGSVISVKNKLSKLKYKN